MSRAMLGDPRPYHPLGLTHAESDDDPECPHDATARPSLDEMLAVRAGRQQVVSEVLTDLTDEQLSGATTPVDAPGYPPANSYPVRRCLGAIIEEEWEHRVFAERDLAELEHRERERRTSE